MAVARHGGCVDGGGKGGQCNKGGKGEPMEGACRREQPVGGGA